MTEDLMKLDLLGCRILVVCIAGGIFRDTFRRIWMLDTQFDMTDNNMITVTCYASHTLELALLIHLVPQGP